MNEILSILLAILLIPILCYFAYGCIKGGYQGVMKKRIKINSMEAPTTNQYSYTYSGTKAIIVGMANIIIGIILFSIALKIVTSLLEELRLI